MTLDEAKYILEQFDSVGAPTYQVLMNDRILGLLNKHRKMMREKIATSMMILCLKEEEENANSNIESNG